MPYYTKDLDGNITASSPTPDYLINPQYTAEEIIYGPDGKLYLAGEAPEPPPPTEAALAEARRAAIISALEAIDRLSIRPLRAEASGVATEQDTEHLAALEAKAAELRAELAALDSAAAGPEPEPEEPEAA